MVVLLDFEREFAATSGAGVLLDGGEKEPSDAGATMGGQDEEVVDIDERASGEGGETAEADGKTDGLGAVVSEEDGGGGVLAQAGDDFAAGGVGERMTVAHGISRIVVEEFEDGVLVVREGEVRLGDANAGSGHAKIRQLGWQANEWLMRLWI
jgi:hypothetical protein